LVADWKEDQGSIKMSFRNHSDKRRRAFAGRLNLTVGRKVSIAAHHILHKLMFDEGRISEAKRKIDAGVGRGCGLNCTFAHMEQSFCFLEEDPTGSRQLCSSAPAHEQRCVYAVFQLPYLGTE
jgi:hypothetical protein